MNPLNIRKWALISRCVWFATTYINIIKFDKQIQLQQCIVAKKEELRRQAKSYKTGYFNSNLNDYKKNYETAKSNLDETIKMRDKALNQLAVLIDECPENAQLLKRSCWDNLITRYKSHQKFLLKWHFQDLILWRLRLIYKNLKLI